MNYINFIVLKEDKATNVYIYPLTESFYSSYINPLSCTRFINPCVEKYSLPYIGNAKKPANPLFSMGQQGFKIYFARILNYFLIIFEYFLL